MTRAGAVGGAAGWVILVAAVVAMLAAGACGGDDGETKTPVATTGSATTAPSGLGGEPIDVVRATLDAINRGDIDAAYANLSSDARKDVSLDDARRVIGGLKSAGIVFSITVDKAGEVNVLGDHADMEISLTVRLGETSIPVNDEATLIREDGQWRVADHFLQTALTAVGLSKPLAEGPRKLDGDGCAVGDPMEGVYAPARLKILDPCLTVTGTVRDDIEHALDGDITFGLILSPEDRRLVNDVNDTNYGGALHLEIVPMDQESVATPKPGDKITVKGPWVTDLAHGHNEIHPVFSIKPAQ
ncbi:MAG TPA: hypothetical protein VLS25_02440 [Dehalococcoidia bacterium]|nr:hypothetical protein [Dehalococcoidia bacterium]